MTKDELEARHQLYQRYVQRWAFHQAAYDGPDELLEQNLVLTRYTDPNDANGGESDENFRRRKREAVGFGYSRMVVSIMVEFLSSRDPVRDWGVLGADDQFMAFIYDCDYSGMDYQAKLLQMSHYAGALGHVVYLVDKPPGGGGTVATDKAKRIHPYLATYLPQAVLDWTIERVDGVPTLTRIKLRDDNGDIRIWTAETWEVWRLGEDGDGDEPILIDSGENPLGEVPAVWQYNERSLYPGIGESDLGTVARIDASIMRLWSHAQEIAALASAPMLQIPIAKEETGERSVQAGPGVVIEYDGDNPTAKADWLRTEVQGPIAAILSMIEQAAAEVFRPANVGARATSKTGGDGQAKSGIALEREFQHLNARLRRRAANIQEAEHQIIRLVAKWMGKEKAADAVVVQWPDDYDVDSSDTVIERYMTLSTVVRSDEATELFLGRLLRQLLPDESPDTLDRIMKAEMGALNAADGTASENDGDGEPMVA
jgi:hypothetical protein